MSPMSKSLNIIIPKNATVKKIFFNKFDLVFSINTLKKYAKGIKLINQRSELVCNPNRSQAIPKKNLHDAILKQNHYETTPKQNQYEAIHKQNVHEAIS